jgi:hypothetical protein
MSYYAASPTSHGGVGAAGGGVLQSAPWSVSQTTAALLAASGNSLPPEDLRILQAQDVDGASVPFLTDESLARIGVPTFGRRVRVLRAAQTALEGEARRQGLRAPQLLQPGGGGAAPAPPTPTNEAALRARDPYASSLVSPSASAGRSGSGYDRFDATLSTHHPAEDANLLDPAALQPAASVRTPSGGRYPPPSAASYERGVGATTRDFGVAQQLGRSAVLNNSNPQHRGRNGALLRRDFDDVDRDRDAEERFARDDDPDQDPAAEGTYDSDVEREFLHPRRTDSNKAAFDPSGRSSAASDADFQTAQGLDHLARQSAQPWLGSIVPPTRPPPFVADPPQQRRLQLEWVHGYRAFDSRSNLVRGIHAHRARLANYL